MKTILTFFVCFLFLLSSLIAQNATIEGVVTDLQGKPISNVSIQVNNIGTSTNNKGYYELIVPSGKMISVTYSHLSFQSHTKRVRIPKGKTLQYNPKLNPKTEEIEEVVVKNQKAEAAGITNIDADLAKKLPSANASIESILKTLPGVSFNNELSTQYNVRGGNFDENLVYINGIEVYRPFLVRSGQQEGLSIVNPSLTQNVNFSAGGFQAKYGDKLSSVLDITYRKPRNFGVALEASLLGASVTVEGLSKNEKFKAILGARYRNNSMIVNTSDVNGNFKPNFTDVQAYLSYDITNKFTLDFLGNFAINNYNFEPVSRQTNFGTIADPKALVVYYDGQEKDRYQTIFGALSGIYEASDNISFRLTASTYQTTEQEYYDILASYGIGNVNSDFGSNDFGDVEFIQNIGTQLDHARNKLQAQISNLQLKGTFQKNNHLIEVGIKYQNENFDDRVVEWQVIDSAGFSLRPPYLLPKNEEPYTPYSGPITPYTNVRATNKVRTQRYSGFAQWSKKSFWKEHTIWFNLGVRAQTWETSGKNLMSNTQFIVSPRAQFSIKPDWDKNMLFRIAGGYYQQPPFYRELRDATGMVHPEVKAQKSIQIVLGNDYSFKMWSRPFKLVSDAYYKKLTDVNPYTLDNVRIRYEAKNNAEAYAAGLDVRLNGEFVPGTQSWFSFGYLITKENIENRGYISRPTDQRLKFGLLFQDYMPKFPQLKMYLNLVYQTGVPGGSPSYANPYLYQNRLKDYFRSDIGLSYVFVDAFNPANKPWKNKFKELSAGLELFNMFDIQNTITNTWVKDVSFNRSIAVPNYLSGRVLNVKIAMRF